MAIEKKNSTVVDLLSGDDKAGREVLPLDKAKEREIRRINAGLADWYGKKVSDAPHIITQVAVH